MLGNIWGLIRNHEMVWRDSLLDYLRCR